MLLTADAKHRTLHPKSGAESPRYVLGDYVPLLG